MKMKKKSLIAGMILMTMTLCSCGGDETENKNNKDTNSSSDKKVEVNIEDVASKLINDIEYEVQMSLIDKEMADGYLDIADLEKEAVVYMGESPSKDMVAVFKCGDDMTELKERMDFWIEDAIDSSTNYLPEEVPKLEECVKKESGEYYAVVVSPDSDKAQEILDDMMK